MSEPDGTTSRAPDEPPGWFDRKENQDKLWYALLGVAVVLTISEFLYARHANFAVEKIPEFFEIFGFLAFVVIVFAGRALRTLIMRDEDYYERD